MAHTNIGDGPAIKYTADIQVPRYRLVRPGTADLGITLATAATDAPLGVTTDIQSEIGESCDVFRNGIRPVVYGAAVTRGAFLTAGAGGKAVPTTTQGDRYFGIAEMAGGVDDVGSIFICPGVM